MEPTSTPPPQFKLIEVPIDLAPAVMEFIQSRGASRASEPRLLNYQTASPVSAPISGAILVLPWVCLALLITWTCIGGPGLEQTLKDFKLDLPGITKVFVTFSRWFRRDFGWVGVWIAVLVIPLAAERLKRPTRDQLRRMLVWSWIIAAAITMAFNQWVAMAQTAPFIVLMETISGGAKR
jgi:hypothetical protein